ncbi:MAG: methionyl-tRNA formyltransferase [Legionellales bacterium]|nr:methionyl-tRNA formyltransferase [Legionellales bacterium]OUX64563.1 MAG: methionyl-tRNA formyltransferase [Gammaproteobacteria bacterium TMED281]
MSKPSIMYAGSDRFACQPLERMIEAGYVPDVVLTNPDRRSGRGRKLTPTPVKALSQQHAIPTWTPLSIKDENAFETFQSYNVDLFICVAYGKIIPTQWLETVDAFNIHPSLLPKWRGCSPIEHTLLFRDTVAGVSIIEMTAKIDAGNILFQKQSHIDKEDNTKTLGDRLFLEGSDLLIQTLQLWESNALPKPIDQDDSKVTFAPKISKQDATIDWNKAAEEIHAMVKAYYDWPVANTLINGEMLKIYLSDVRNCDIENSSPGQIIAIDDFGVWVTCRHGELCIREGLIPGKRRMPIQEIIKGRKDLFVVGEYFGAT